MTLDFQAFEKWLQKLSDGDRQYLQRHSTWEKEYQQARKSSSLPRGFVEKTMEILEGGSESET